MKKIFFSLLAIAALASCAKTEPVYLEDNSEIKLAPVTSVATKTVNGSIDGTVYPAEEEFNVWAYWANQPAGSKFEKDETSAGAYLNDVTFVNKGQYWGGQTTYYWPKNGSLRFAAYSPETVTGVSHALASDTYTVNYTQTNNTKETVDFLLAATSPSYTAQTAAENVSVVFEHALAWITIQVKAANADAAKAFTIKDVIVEDAYTAGTLAAAMTDGIQYGEWSAQATEADYEVVKGKTINVTTEATVVEDNAKGTVVIPQVPTTLTINYTQNKMEGTPELGSQTVNVPLELDDETNNKWEPGKHYIYTVIFDLDEILINPSVVDWEDVVVEDKEFDNAGQIATVKNEEELLAALAKVDLNGNHVVTEIELTDEVALSKNLAVDYSVAFVGGGFSGSPIAVTGGVVSFENVAFANGNGTDETAVYVRNGNTNITFQNCTFDAYKWEAIQYTSEDGLWVCVDGCTFNAAAHRDLHLQVKNASKAEVKITNNTFKGDDADSYVTVYGFDHERMILADNVTEKSANTVNVWISDLFNANDLTLEGFVEPAAYSAALTASTILNADYEGEQMVLGGYDLDGAGHTFTMTESTVMFGLTTSKGHVSNLTVNGYNHRNTNNKVLYGIVVNKLEGDVVLHNVISTNVAYPFNTQVSGSSEYTLTVEDCLLEGWTSYSSFASAKFINTSFKIGDFFASEDPSVDNVWNGTIKPYVETVLEGCSFDKGFNVDLSALASGAKVTLTNCTVDGVVLTAANVAAYLVGDVAGLTF